MTWDDMDFEERSRTLYQAARGDLLAKQIAHYASTTSGVVLAFARANGIPIRTRVPGLHAVKVRKRRSHLSPISTVVTPTGTKRGLRGAKTLDGQGEQAHART